MGAGTNFRTHTCGKTCAKPTGIPIPMIFTTDMGDIFGAILVNQLGQLCGLLQWVRVSVQ
jgi:hypothetical protein